MNVLDFNGRVIGHLDDAGNFLPETQVSQVPHPSPITHSPIKDTPIQTTYTPVDIVDASRATKNHSGFLSQDLPYTAKDLAPATRASQVTCDTGVSGPATQVSQVNAVTGDELDLLLDECCICVEQMFKAYGRLDPELQMNDGQHSLVLTDGMTRLDINRGHRGVRSWITEGTLRSSNQLTPVLNGFKASMDAKVRMRKVDPNWKFDNDCLIILSSRFGIDAPRTVAELQAKKAADQLERQRLWRERQEQSQATQQAFKASEAGREKERQQFLKQFKEDTISAALDALVTPVWSDLPKITAEMSDEDKDTVTRRARADAQDNMRERRRVEKIIRPIVEQSNLSADAIVRLYEGARSSWVELEELMGEANIPTIEEMIANALGRAVMRSKESAVFEPSQIPPGMDGVERYLFDTEKALTAFLKKFTTIGLPDFRPNVDFVIRIDNSFSYVVDVIPPNLAEAHAAHVAMFDQTQDELQGARNE